MTKMSLHFKMHWSFQQYFLFISSMIDSESHMKLRFRGRCYAFGSIFWDIVIHELMHNLKILNLLFGFEGKLMPDVLHRYHANIKILNYRLKLQNKS